MDHGTDCCDILNNKVIPLRKGYIAVMNRSQKDIQENLPIRDGLEKEKQFFLSHPKYRQISDKCGTVNLSRTLNLILMHHIRDCLPEIKARINSLLMNVQTNLDAMGESMEDLGNNYKGVTLLRILSQFSSNFKDKVDGKTAATETLSDMPNELYGGARISFIFNEIFGKRIKNFDALEALSDEDIRTAIANANGTRPSLFVPEISFDVLVRKQISRLEQPGLHCLDLVLEEVKKMINQSDTVELSRFPDLKDKAMDIVGKLLRTCLAPAQKMISNLISIELAYINTSHPDFVGGKAAVAAASAAAQATRLKAAAQVPPTPNGGVGTSSIAIDTSTTTPHPNGNQVMSPPPATPPPGGFMALFQSPAKLSNTTTIGKVSKANDDFNKQNIRLAQVAENI